MFTNSGIESPGDIARLLGQAKRIFVWATEMGAAEAELILSNHCMEIVVVEKKESIVYGVEGVRYRMKVFLWQDIGKEKDLNKTLFQRLLSIRLLENDILLSEADLNEEEEKELSDGIAWAVDSLAKEDFGIREVFEDVYRMKFDALKVGWFLHPKRCGVRIP